METITLFLQNLLMGRINIIWHQATTNERQQNKMTEELKTLHVQIKTYARFSCASDQLV